jgi:putative ATP-grasp target RiPP
MVQARVPGRAGTGDAAAPEADPLYAASGLFPLGRPFGLLPASQQQCPVDLLPFGLRRAVSSPAVPVGDLSAYGYDHDQQIGVLRVGETVVPLLRHTTGQTRTTTNPDGHKGPDSDTDHRED